MFLDRFCAVSAQRAGAAKVPVCNASINFSICVFSISIFNNCFVLFPYLPFVMMKQDKKTY